MRELIENVIDWAYDKGLMDNTTADRQALKMVSEVGEFADEILKGNKDKQITECGDVLVTVILTSAKLGFDIETALSVAYEKISKRKGATVNGVFVKEGDL